jgi:uncharacterized protein YegL
MATRKKKAKSVEPMITRVALVIDKSGSMSNIQKQALSGLNEQIQALRESEAGDTYVTLIQFDSQVKVSFNQKNSKELKNLEPADYRPTGGTAMYDAVGTAIDRLLEEQNAVENVAYLVIVISDGEENSSRRVSQWQLASQIKELQATGKWTFTYMLSNVDLSVARNLGVWSGNIAAWNSNSALGATAGFATVTNSTAGYLRSRSVTGNAANTSFYVQPEMVNGGTAAGAAVPISTTTVVPNATATVTWNTVPNLITNCPLGHPLSVTGLCFTCNPVKLNDTI